MHVGGYVINIYVYTECIWRSLWRSCVRKTKSISVDATNTLAHLRDTPHISKHQHNFENPTLVYFITYI